MLQDRQAIKTAVRFALAIVVVDLIVWRVFGQGTPVVMGSFAVICMLYFLDYPGSARERLTGYSATAVVGLVAVILGSLLGQVAWLAVLAAFLVTFTFVYTRVLRGYAARASLGLQGAFFLPLVAGVSMSEIPSMALSWLVGCAVAVTAGMVVFPLRNDSPLHGLLSTWLADAASLCADEGAGKERQAHLEGLRTTAEQIDQAARVSGVTLGMVGIRQRALAWMVDGTRWGSAALGLLGSADGSAQGAAPTTTLLSQSQKGFTCASQTLAGVPAGSVPDLAAARALDLQSLDGMTHDQLEQHYPARLVSIVAMRMLWLSGIAQGRHYPTPDIGSTGDRSAGALLRLNLTIRSVWFTNALRAAACIAACVLLVKLLGLQHGLWVVLAALSVMQVSFSATTGGVTALRMASGAAVGVGVASLGALLDLPHMAFVVLLPILAVLASLASQRGAFVAQAFYTPFALANLAALEWASDRGLELLRVENIALGVGVAAAFTLIVYPYGLGAQLTRQVMQATADSAAYLGRAISIARGGSVAGVDDSRTQCVRSLTLLESTLSAACERPTLSQARLAQAERAESVSRDELLGGDACRQLAQFVSATPSFRPVAEAIADWWEAFGRR